MGEIHHYYKFGRHLQKFQQKAYLLFSHCGHSLFSLWMMEQQTPSGIVEANPTLAALFEKLDFDTLRYYDYKRRVLHANAYEAHLKNESKWFRFWTDALEALDTSEAPRIGYFSKCLLNRFMGDGLLDGKLTKEAQQALSELLGSPQMGRLLLRSTWVLEDLISAAARCCARQDPAVHGYDQMLSLTCLLSQVRRAIVYESTVRGPYALSDGVGWEPPSTRLRWSCGKTPGLLNVTSDDESGQLVCTYTSPSHARKKERSWSRAIVALPCDYEELLFKTWDHETGRHHRGVEVPAQSGACWVVRSVEADHLETVCRHTDTLLETLGTRREYHSVIHHLARLARNERDTWEPAELPWTLIRDLDKTIGRLKFACREAEALGGDNPMAKVISDLWPPESQPSEPTAAVPAKGPAAEGETSRPTTPVSDSTPVPNGGQDPADEDRRTDAEDDTRNDRAGAGGEGGPVPHASPLPTGPSESGQGQPGEAATEAGRGVATDDPARPASASTPASPPGTSRRDQDRARSSQAGARQKPVQRRAEKLATTMKILLGPSAEPEQAVE